MSRESGNEYRLQADLDWLRGVVTRLGASEPERSRALELFEELPAHERAAYREALAGHPAQAEERRDLNRAYRLLYAGLDGMLSSHRLKEQDIPDDYQWLVKAMSRVAECRAEIGT